MLRDEWQEKREMIEAALAKELCESESLSGLLTESMRYSLLAGGKRLRPVLLMASAEAVGGRGQDYLAAACAVEMIHTYSLIHDDLPAMDDDDYRRGKPTNHKVFGSGMATLAGDALLTLAFEVLLRQRGVPAETLVDVTREISIAAGCGGMVGGQAIDIAAAGRSIDDETLFRMHMGKTGALFRASVRAGAMLAGGSASDIACLTLYSEKFGLAFQITDDILDVAGDESSIGKPVGSDAKNDKPTYVTLLSVDGARRLARRTVDEAKEALSPLGNRAVFLAGLAEFLINRDR